MDPDPPHGAGPGHFPAQGHAVDHWEADEEARGGGYPPLVSAM